jgi:hypothetical protein
MIHEWNSKGQNFNLTRACTKCQWSKRDIQTDKKFSFCSLVMEMLWVQHTLPMPEVLPNNGKLHFEN